MAEQQNNPETNEQVASSELFDLDQLIQQILSRKHWESLALRKKISDALKYAKLALPSDIVLLGSGATTLALSYLWSSSILTFIGLGLTLWGVLIKYISRSRHVRAELLSSALSSMQKSIDDLVSYMGYTGQVIFFHPKSLVGLGQGYIFIPHLITKLEGNSAPKLDVLNLLPYSSEASVPSLFLDPRGIFLAAPSQGLVDLFEKELNLNFALANLEYIREALPKLLIEELKMADDMSIEKNESNDVVMKISGKTCADMCRSSRNKTRPGNDLGCPLCSALALVISKVSAKPVCIKETNIIDDNTISTTYSELSV